MDERPAEYEGLPEERFVERHIREGRKDDVVRVLCDGISGYCGEKRFDEAEKLRDLLIDTVPMALTEIIDTGELIETEKSRAMDPENIKPWADLYSNLTLSEAPAFYFALTDLTVMPGEKVFEQGAYGNRLYFVQSGRLNLCYFDQDLQRDVIHRTIQRGDVAGTDSFFNFTNFSETLTAERESNLRVLDKKRYEKLLMGNPALESKLCNFCEEIKKVCSINSGKRMVRRVHKRYRVSHPGSVQRIDAEGNTTGPITKMLLADISVGGLCYILPHLKRHDGAHLLGSMLKIDFTYPKEGFREDVTLTGKVVSVRFHPFGECSVHVRFDKGVEHTCVIEIALTDHNFQ